MTRFHAVILRGNYWNKINMSDVWNLFVRYLRYASPFEGGRGMISKKSSPFVWIPVSFGCATLSKEGQ